MVVEWWFGLVFQPQVLGILKWKYSRFKFGIICLTAKARLKWSHATDRSPANQLDRVKTARIALEGVVQQFIIHHSYTNIATQFQLIYVIFKAIFDLVTFTLIVPCWVMIGCSDALSKLLVHSFLHPSFFPFFVFCTLYDRLQEAGLNWFWCFDVTIRSDQCIMHRLGIKLCCY